MYGLVNKALQELIVTRHGAAIWDEVLTRAGGGPPVFVSLTRYPDELTARLVAAACAVTGVADQRLLRDFGEHWIEAVQRDYGEMFDFAGENLVDFLNNLDRLHARVALLFPEMRAPSFRCTASDCGGLRLHYDSGRSGLAPFVEGMLAGLGKRFGVAVEIVHDKRRAAGADHDEFVIRCV